MKKTANIWEYKVGINAIIANFVCMGKTRIANLVSQIPAHISAVVEGSNVGTQRKLSERV